MSVVMLVLLLPLSLSLHIKQYKGAHLCKAYWQGSSLFSWNCSSHKNIDCIKAGVVFITSKFQSKLNGLCVSFLLHWHRQPSRGNSCWQVLCCSRDISSGQISRLKQERCKCSIVACNQQSQSYQNLLHKREMWCALLEIPDCLLAAGFRPQGQPWHTHLHTQKRICFMSTMAHGKYMLHSKCNKFQHCNLAGSFAQEGSKHGFFGHWRTFTGARTCNYQQHWLPISVQMHHQNPAALALERFQHVPWDFCLNTE